MKYTYKILYFAEYKEVSIYRLIEDKFESIFITCEGGWWHYLKEAPERLFDHIDSSHWKDYMTLSGYKNIHDELFDTFLEHQSRYELKVFEGDDLSSLLTMVELVS